MWVRAKQLRSCFALFFSPLFHPSISAIGDGAIERNLTSFLPIDELMANVLLAKRGQYCSLSFGKALDFTSKTYDSAALSIV